MVSRMVNMRCLMVTGCLSHFPPQAWQCASGHMLVHVDLNNKPAGFMILDTGASGFTIEQKAATRLKLPLFGELHIAGLTSKVGLCLPVKGVKE